MKVQFLFQRLYFSADLNKYSNDADEPNFHGLFIRFAMAVAKVVASLFGR